MERRRQEKEKVSHLTIITRLAKWAAIHAQQPPLFALRSRMLVAKNESSQ
jgi:hypothetical protein